MRVRDIINGPGGVRTILQDSNKIYWSDAELLASFEEGFYLFCKETKLFRKTSALDADQNPYLFTLPEDLLELLWVAYDGTHLDWVSMRELRDIDVDFAKRQGTPRYAYQDASDLFQLRLSPIPTLDDEDLADIYQVTIATDDGYDGSGEFDLTELSTWDGYGFPVAFQNTDRTATQRQFSGIGRPVDAEDLSDFTGDMFTAYDSTRVDDQPEIRFWKAPLWVSQDTTASPLLAASDAPRKDRGESGDYGSVISILSSKVMISYVYLPALVGDTTEERLDTELDMIERVETPLKYWILAQAYSKGNSTEDRDKRDHNTREWEKHLGASVRRHSGSFANRKLRTPSRFR